jgi:hypothetical protein
MLRLFVERILYGQSGMSTVGVPLLIGGQERLLFAKLTNLLSDGDGHRMGWDWRGAASLKPCWKHFNVFRKDSGLAHRMPGYVEIDCSDPALLRSWTASEVYFAADSVAAAAGQVAAGTMTKGDFQEHEEKQKTPTTQTHKQTNTQTQHKHNKATTNIKLLEELEKSVGINNGNGMLMSKLLRCCAAARPCVISLYDLVAFPLSRPCRCSFVATLSLFICSDLVAFTL